MPVRMLKVISSQNVTTVVNLVIIFPLLPAGSSSAKGSFV